MSNSPVPLVCRIRYRSTLVFALIIALLWGHAAHAEQRVALSIGNASYTGLTSLKNAANDGADVAAALQGLGFEVFSGTDMTRAQTLTLLEDFRQAAKNADIVVFFYAGHAFQIDERNYIVPVDAKLKSMEDAVVDSMDLNVFLQALNASGGTRVVILDACRNNPLDELKERSADTLRNGLAKLDRDKDFFIAYSTQPDNVAYDGIDRNSFFTEALLNHIHTPGQSVSDLMISVRRDVIHATGGQQVPFDRSSLTDQLVFDPRPATGSPETLLWQIAAKSQDGALAQVYLDRYPDGAHRDAARELLVNLPAAKPSSFAAGVEETELWDLAQRTRSRALLSAYVANYPDGQFLSQATALLTKIPERDAVSPARKCERLATHPRDTTAVVSGVSFDTLSRNAIEAVTVCRDAIELVPDLPRYKGLLARALAAAGQIEAAIDTYEAAAELGDLRAMVSLGLIHESGTGVQADGKRALEYYEKAALGGHPDGAINLAVSLFEGVHRPQDIGRAVELLFDASNQGSAIASYNLGKLTQDNIVGSLDQSLAYYRAASSRGHAPGHLAAAILLDQGLGVPADPQAAAIELLFGVAQDAGQTKDQLVAHPKGWDPHTIRAMQGFLAEAGLYGSLIDGIPGRQFYKAIDEWRNGGFDPKVLVDE